MLSLEAKLASVIEDMSESQRAKFYAEVKERGIRGNVEPQLHAAERIMSEFPGREKRYVRNNGAARRPSEAEQLSSAMQEADATLFEALEASRPSAKGLSAALAESGGEFRRKPEENELTESQRKDLEFCRLLGMSEADSIKVAKSGIGD